VEKLNKISRLWFRDEGLIIFASGAMGYQKDQGISLRIETSIRAHKITHTNLT